MTNAAAELAARTKQNETDIEVLTALRLAAAAAAVTDHGALTGLADDDHSQYHNDARGDARYDAIGTAAAAVAAHEGLADPHPGYLTPAEGSAAFAPLSHGHVAADVSDFDTQVRTNRLDQMAAPAASVSFADQQATSFRVENRTSDPGSPTTGQIWLRTDL